MINFSWGNEKKRIKRSVQYNIEYRIIVHAWECHLRCAHIFRLFYVLFSFYHTTCATSTTTAAATYYYYYYCYCNQPTNQPPSSPPTTTIIKKNTTITIITRILPRSSPNSKISSTTMIEKKNKNRPSWRCALLTLLVLLSLFTSCELHR